MIEALVGIGALVVINIVAVAYGYGKTTQKLNDLCRRMDRIEGCGKEDKV